MEVYVLIFVQESLELNNNNKRQLYVNFEKYGENGAY